MSTIKIAAICLASFSVIASAIALYLTLEMADRHRRPSRRS